MSKNTTIQTSITNRTPNTERFFNDISKEDILTPQEEVELVNKIKEGDQKALDRLVKCNLKFVVSIAKQFQNRGLPLDDLINEGGLGLVKAAKRFDHTRGFKFISYAVFWIKQSILAAIYQDSRMVRIPSSQILKLNKFRELYISTEQRLEREPTEYDLEIDFKSYEFFLNVTKPISLDAPINDDETSTRLDIIPCNSDPLDKHMEHNFLRNDLEMAMKCLTEKEKRIIKLSVGYGEGNEHGVPMSNVEIAYLENVSGEAIRVIKKNALKKLAKKKHLLQLEYLN